MLAPPRHGEQHGTTVDRTRPHPFYPTGLFTDVGGPAYQAMDRAFRKRFHDSFGHGLKFTWWMMGGNILNELLPFSMHNNQGAYRAWALPEPVGGWRTGIWRPRLSCPFIPRPRTIKSRETAPDGMCGRSRTGRTLQTANSIGPDGKWTDVSAQRSLSPYVITKEHAGTVFFRLR